MENIVVEYNGRRKPSIICKLCRVFCCFLLILRISLLICNILSYSLFISTTPQFVVTLLIDILIAASAVGSINFKRRASYILPGIAAAVLILIYSTSLFSYTNDIRYTSYDSPDLTKTIVIKENGYMFSGNTRFYQRVNLLFVKDTGERISMDDGYQAISGGDLRVDWIDNENAVFNYYDKSTGELLLTKTIKLN